MSVSITLIRVGVAGQGPLVFAYNKSVNYSKLVLFCSTGFVWTKIRVVFHRLVRRQLVSGRREVQRRKRQLHRQRDGGGRRGPLHHRGTSVEPEQSGPNKLRKGQNTIQTLPCILVVLTNDSFFIEILIAPKLEACKKCFPRGHFDGLQ